MRFETYIEKAHEAAEGHTFKVWLHDGHFFGVNGPSPLSVLNAYETLARYREANWSKVKDKPSFDDEHLAKHEANEKVLAAQPTTPVKDKDYDE
jgi:hypothetical protein